MSLIDVSFHALRHAGAELDYAASVVRSAEGQLAGHVAYGGMATGDVSAEHAYGSMWGRWSLALSDLAAALAASADGLRAVAAEYEAADR